MASPWCAVSSKVLRKLHAHAHVGLSLYVGRVWTACLGARGLAATEIADADEHPSGNTPLPVTTHSNRRSGREQSFELRAFIKSFSPWLDTGWELSVSASQLNSKRSSPLRLVMLFVLCIAQGATAQTAEVRLGGLFQHKTVKVGRFAAFVMAVQEINNSTELLPYNELR